MNFRNLMDNEKAVLEKQGCFCADWSSIKVAPEFKADNIHQVRFEGKVKLGVFNGEIAASDGISRPSGLFSSYIKNCKIGDQVYISNVGLLSDYLIESKVLIENVSSITMEGESTFGNGTEVEVLNEGGGRELLLFDKLSSQIAYLIANYRHEEVMVSKLEALIKAYCVGKKSDKGLIQEGASIRDAGVIKNVVFGPMAGIFGAQLLQEGTVASSKEDPATVGHGVIAKNFILLSGAKVDSGAILDKCFIGQGTKIGKQYSIEGSVFFANCEGFHGEAVSLFAGPYTVSHHKSSLLIAGMLSFYNAGSGTNQSNHMYKLGPLHQGTLERGSKTGSFSYLLWPCKVGAFSVVMDKHGANFDTSEFPFSYLTVEDGKSMLTPAMNLFTVGTRRDSDKWPNRDKRKDSNKMDLIHFELFSPYVVQKMIQGSDALQGLLEKASKKQKYVTYKGISIYRLLLKTCRKYYQIGLKKYYGEKLLQRLEGAGVNGLDDIRQALKVKKDGGAGNWVDISGLFAPASAIEGVIKGIKEGTVRSLEGLQSALTTIFEDYDELSWSYYAQTLKQELDIDLNQISVEQISALIQDWKVNSLKLNNMILKDAEKEFDPNSKVGFGVDGDQVVKDADFTAVRGTYEDNKFIKSLQTENEEIEQKASGLLAQFENI